MTPPTPQLPESMFSSDDQRVLWDSLETQTVAAFDQLLLWAASVITADPTDPIDASMLRFLCEGLAVVVEFNESGGPLFRLTALGKAHTEEVVLQKPENRELIARLDAARGTNTTLPPLKNATDAAAAD